MRRIFLCTVLLIATACDGKKQEATTVVPHAETSRTRCIGRLLFDLPEDFELGTGNTSIFAPPGLTENDAPVEFVIHQVNMPLEEFQLRVDKRKAELIKEAGTDNHILKKSVQMSKEAALFRILRIDDAYVSELHLWIGGVYLVLESKSYQHSYERAEARLLELKVNISIFDPDKKHGFCVGPLVVDGKYVDESTRLRFSSPKRPDVFLSMHISTYGQDEKVPLLKRVKADNSLLSIFNVDHTVLRAGERAIVDMRGQEWLSWAHLEENSAKRQHKFALETIKRTPSERAPWLHIELDSGENGNSGKDLPNSFNDQQAMAFWDAVIGSIRQRDGRAAP